MNAVRYTFLIIANNIMLMFVNSLHYGKDKAAIPRTWPHSQKAGYRKATDLFLEFTELCFSEFIPHDSPGLDAHLTVFSSGRTPCGCTSRYRC